MRDTIPRVTLELVCAWHPVAPTAHPWRWRARLLAGAAVVAACPHAHRTPTLAERCVHRLAAGKALRPPSGLAARARGTSPDPGASGAV